MFGSQRDGDFDIYIMNVDGSNVQRLTDRVGYGKSLMFFHMLRSQLGDEAYVQALRHLYSKNKFQMASFDDLRKSFEAVSGNSLSNEFNLWVERPGAPELRIRKAKAVAGSFIKMTECSDIHKSSFVNIRFFGGDHD